MGFFKVWLLDFQICYGEGLSATGFGIVPPFQNGRLLYFGFLVEIQEAFFRKVLVYQGFPVLEGALTNVRLRRVC